MIARLSGRLVVVEPDAAIVDVGGVGYRVHLSAIDLSELGAAGSEVMLHTYLHVRDSEMTLFGARDRAALDLFRALLGVNGVGPRVALAVLGSGPPDRLRSQIEAEDVTALTRVAGVGKKTAQRIILDLKGKLPDLDGGTSTTRKDDDAVEALVSLGYSRKEAEAALEGIDTKDVEERIRAGLRAMAG